MNIVALDLSLTCSGWASYSDGEVSSGIWKPPKKGAERLDAACNWIDSTITRASLILIEGYAFGARGRGIISLGELGGVARLVIYQAGIPFIEIAPTQLKKFCTGKGNARKEEVLVAVLKRFGDIRSNDEADALGLLQMALNHYKLPGAIEVPQLNKSVLQGISWPKMGD